MEDLRQHILVYSGSLVTVQKLKHDLEKEGINVYLKDTGKSATNTGFADFSSSKLFILEDEVEKAKPIVEKFKQQFEIS